MAPNTASAVSITTKPKNKKIVFGDDGEVLDETAVKKLNAEKKEKKKKFKLDNSEQNVKSEDEAQAEDDEDDYFAKRDKQRQKKKDENNEADTNKKWFNVVSIH